MCKRRKAWIKRRLSVENGNFRSSKKHRNKLYSRLRKSAPVEKIAVAIAAVEAVANPKFAVRSLGRSSVLDFVLKPVRLCVCHVAVRLSLAKDTTPF